MVFKRGTDILRVAASEKYLDGKSIAKKEAEFAQVNATWDALGFILRTEQRTAIRLKKQRVYEA